MDRWCCGYLQRKGHGVDLNGANHHGGQAVNGAHISSLGCVTSSQPSTQAARSPRSAPLAMNTFLANSFCVIVLSSLMVVVLVASLELDMSCCFIWDDRYAPRLDQTKKAAFVPG